MKITFIKDCPPIPEAGNSAYVAGTQADLRRGDDLIALGYAREGWDAPPKVTAVPQPDPPRKVKELSLNDYTVAELKEMAREAGYSGYSTMNKAELIKLIGG